MEMTSSATMIAGSLNSVLGNFFLKASLSCAGRSLINTLNSGGDDVPPYIRPLGIGIAVFVMSPVTVPTTVAMNALS